MAPQVVNAEAHGDVFAVAVHLLGFTKAVEKTERISKVEICLRKCALVADFLEQARRLEMVLNRAFVVVEPLKDSAQIRGKFGQRCIVSMPPECFARFMAGCQRLARLAGEGKR